MGEWLANPAGSGFIGAVLWTFGALLLLVLVLLAIRLLRGRAPGAFAVGGRGRLARLGVVEVAAVDSQRRLVLVRRDDVEHLILTGGAGDLVIERGISRREAGGPLLRSGPAATKAEPPHGALGADREDAADVGVAALPQSVSAQKGREERPRGTPAIEDEMSRLLDDLAAERERRG